MFSWINRLFVRPCFSFFKKNDREREFVRTPVAAMRMLNGIVQSSTDILHWELGALELGIFYLVTFSIHEFLRYNST